MLSQEVKDSNKNQNFGIFSQTQHATHLKLIDKMYNYDIDPASIVKDTGWTQFHLQMDGWTNEQMKGQSETIIPPFSFIDGGIIKVCGTTSYGKSWINKKHL